MEKIDQGDLSDYWNDEEESILTDDILVPHLLEITHELNNIQFLWFSVIQLALIDVGIIRSRASNQPSTNRQWFDARRWLLSSNHGPQSLVWIWEHLPFKIKSGVFISLLLNLKCKRCGIKLLDSQCNCRWYDENNKL